MKRIAALAAVAAALTACSTATDGNGHWFEIVDPMTNESFRCYWDEEGYQGGLWCREVTP